MTARKAIEGFVRDTLGCRCPEQVFRAIDVTESPQAFSDLTYAHAIAVGGRLLVLVVEGEDWRAIQARLGEFFTRGREVRDSEGFNRFRLVIATRDTTAARLALTQGFDALSDKDERLHLHIVAPEQLPALPHRSRN